METKFFDFNITHARSLMGIRYWAQIYATSIPRYEIFTYMGTDTTKGLHFFKSRRDGTLFIKRLDELNALGFRPFLLNLEQIEEFYQNMEG